MAIRERLNELLLSDRGRKILVFGAIAVMLLLLLSTVSCERKETSAVREETENAAEIEKTLERRLEQLISQIDGVGSVSVMVTLDTVSERVYEKDKRSESSSQGNSESRSESESRETEVVLSGSAKQPVQIGTVQPKVRGAAVVCSGASDPVIRERVTNTVAKALNIGVSRVYVTC
ncbi:MAG: hypothetical protein J1F09_07125 [Oscillospiraceae bacterium]|nr:hypothetical protein [Oscillospiraceae bacterium]